MTRGVSWDDRRSNRPRRLRAGVAAAIALSTVGSTAPALAAPAPKVDVIVREHPAAGDRPEQAVRSLGGSVGRQLGIIGGFTARVPAPAVTRLRTAPGVVAITNDVGVELHAMIDGYDAEVETGSMYNSAQIMSAQALWGNNGTGAGVDVALIDSGVTRVKGLDAPGKVVDGPDLSFESQDTSKRYVDGFGHGTHMAGIIAGRDDDGYTRPRDRPHGFYGIAPEARIVNMKVASSNGATDVSQVIAAIDWVVQNRNKNGLNIRVLNLSFGTKSAQSYDLDPLSYAAEVAWQRGIFVVVAAGNDGTGTGKLNNPAYNPFVMAVGADDTKGTNAISDDVIPAWSSQGDGSRNPDLVAPGRSIQSLRTPGSFIDTNFPGGKINTRFTRGSGTSQAAAMISGAAAATISQRPSITVDALKELFRKSTVKLPAADSKAQGNGLLSLDVVNRTPTPKVNPQAWKKAVGVGTLESARGGAHVVMTDADGNDVELKGEVDIFGRPFDAARWAEQCLAGTSWSGGDWNGSTWTGTSWSGTSWSGTSWSGTSWSGIRWSGTSWSGIRWSGTSWSGTSWSGTSWSSTRWE